MNINVNKLRESEIEYIHCEFLKFANTFLEYGSKKPILLKGPKMCGKKTMVNQLGKILEFKHKKYNFVNFTIDDEQYFDHDELKTELRKSYEHGEVVVIENLEKMGTYDNIILSVLVEEFYRHPNPNFHMIILENSNNITFRSLSDKIRKVSQSITVGEDPIIVSKIQKKLKESKQSEQLQKQKVIKK